MKLFRVFLTTLVVMVTIIAFGTPALAFCGFYVAKADTNLYNQASQVIIARDGNRTLLTMANDYQGDVAEFAMVVPVPGKITEEQVNIGNSEILTRLDGFSAPRLVEYFDTNPCDFNPRPTNAPFERVTEGARGRQEVDQDTLGVTVEARFSVGEYDIVILSADESKGLATWLTQNDYQIPEDASKLFEPYINSKMTFFVAKVNLEQFEASEYQSLRPLMIAYEYPEFMLPIRLGMINAQQEQDLIVYLLSPKGQVELTNYRTVQIPSNVNIPEFVEKEFPDFYTAMFQTSYEKEKKKVAFLEYAWDMAWCDPCAANPLTPEELREAGVFWLNPRQSNNVFLTRLHVRYSRDQFPEDLKFQETSNRQNFQGRYVIQHPFKGEMSCDAAEQYKQGVRQRQEQEIETLAKLTRWNIDSIREKVVLVETQVPSWWQNVWDSVKFVVPWEK